MASDVSALIKLFTQFGMTPASRVNLSIPEPAKRNRFADDDAFAEFERPEWQGGVRSPCLGSRRPVVGLFVAFRVFNESVQKLEAIAAAGSRRCLVYT